MRISRPNSMKKMQIPYQPIACGFHDYLEHFATLRKPIEIQFYSEEGLVSVLKETIITNLSGGRNGEYIHVNIKGAETLIRMDNLISVDGVRADKFTDSNCSTN